MAESGEAKTGRVNESESSFKRRYRWLSKRGCYGNTGTTDLTLASRQVLAPSSRRTEGTHPSRFSDERNTITPIGSAATQ